MYGKDWLAGQNWIHQFQECCRHDGHDDLIRTVDTGRDVYQMICDTHRTFGHPIICNNERWITRSQRAFYERYEQCI